MAIPVLVSSRVSQFVGCVCSGFCSGMYESHTGLPNHSYCLPVISISSLIGFEDRIPGSERFYYSKSSDFGPLLPVGLACYLERKGCAAQTIRGAVRRGAAHFLKIPGQNTRAKYLGQNTPSKRFPINSQAVTDHQFGCINGVKRF